MPVVRMKMDNNTKSYPTTACRPSPRANSVLRSAACGCHIEPPVRFRVVFGGNWLE